MLATCVLLYLNGVILVYSLEEGSGIHQQQQQQGNSSVVGRVRNMTDARPRHKKPIPDEHLLLDALLESYHKYSRPVINASMSVTVKFGLTLVQISDMDEVNQVLTINVWLEQEWVDERLTWDPKDYNNLHILRIPCEKLWLPDVVLYNSADDFTTGYMNSKAMVRHDGNVFWPPPAKFRSSCKIDITYFPFDDQTCELKFGSWTYDGFQVDITNRSSEVDLQNYVFSGEWELIRVGIRRTEVTYACCKEPYPDVRFTIVIRRKTLYYLFNIIFPCLWLTILSLLGFWLPPDSGEKITLGITVLLAFSVFMLLIAESMPATSEFVPLIGIYLTVTMGMTSLSIILTVFVLQLHHVGPHKKRVPHWMRTIIFDVLARLVCMGQASASFKTNRQLMSQRRHKVAASRDGQKFETYGGVDSGQTRHIGAYSVPGRNLPYTAQGVPQMGNGLPGKNQQMGNFKSGPVPQINSIATSRNFNETVNLSGQGDRVGVAEMRHSPMQNNLYRPAASVDRNNDISRLAPPTVPFSQIPMSSTSNESLRHWNDMAVTKNNIGLASQWPDDHLLEIETEWQFVAHVMDRTLFWLFLFVATFSSLSILVIRPLLKPDL